VSKKKKTPQDVSKIRSTPKTNSLVTMETELCLLKTSGLRIRGLLGTFGGGERLTLGKLEKRGGKPEAKRAARSGGCTATEQKKIEKRALFREKKQNDRTPVEGAGVPWGMHYVRAGGLPGSH